ncbi:MAG: hypothetical protein WAW37_07535 [Syntrophobacteraceae bacterium]
MNKSKSLVRITGLVILAAGIILNFANLAGWLIDADRQKVLHWALKSTKGIPLEEHEAQVFYKRFPPPYGKEGNLTHITKQVVRSELGGLPMTVCINYMKADGSRTPCVATKEEVRKWADETPYPWIAWFLTLFGFCQVLLDIILDSKGSSKNAFKIQ